VTGNFSTLSVATAASEADMGYNGTRISSGEAHEREAIPVRFEPQRVGGHTADVSEAKAAGRVPEETMK
jgi:hypothetical protein